jgi:hypothetical protein
MWTDQELTPSPALSAFWVSLRSRRASLSRAVIGRSRDCGVS